MRSKVVVEERSHGDNHKSNFFSTDFSTETIRLLAVRFAFGSPFENRPRERVDWEWLGGVFKGLEQKKALLLLIILDENGKEKRFDLERKPKKANTSHATSEKEKLLKGTSKFWM